MPFQAAAWVGSFENANPSRKTNASRKVAKAQRAQRNLSCGSCLERPGAVLAEIGCRGSLEALFAVDGGVDLVIRKREPIAGRDVLQTFHFTELQEDGGFFHGRFALLFANGLEGLQRGEVLLQAPVDALLVKAQELDLLR